jgi:multidrug efflux pump subunit AcrB
MTLFGEQIQPFPHAGPRHAREASPANWRGRREKAVDLGLDAASLASAGVAAVSVAAALADGAERSAGHMHVSPTEYDFVTVGHAAVMDVVGQISSAQETVGLDWRVDSMVALATGALAWVLATRPHSQ